MSGEPVVPENGTCTDVPNSMARLRYSLGTVLRDTITDHAGIATMVRFGLDGPASYLLEGKVTADGSLREFWFEEERLELMPGGPSPGFHRPGVTQTKKLP